MLRRYLAIVMVFQLLVPTGASGEATDNSTLLVDRGALSAPGTGAAVGAGSSDPYSGAARYSVPIRVAPGTGGLQPALTLRYSSHDRSPSWVGKGWSLEMGAIRVSLKEGVPAYDGSEDFQLDGQDLVADPNIPDRFHTRRESFLRIDRVGDSWEVRAKNGTILRYGTNENTRIRNDLDPNAPVLPIYSWLLSEQEDDHGNIVQYSYDDTSDPGRRYPMEIRYTLRRNGSVLESLSGSAAPDNTVDRIVSFHLEDRPDQRISYAAGFLDHLSQRLEHIDVRVAGQLLRRYELSYSESLDSFASLLGEVREYGTDANDTSPTSPRVHTFNYHSNVASGRTGWGPTDPDDPNQLASDWELPPNVFFTRSDHLDGGTRVADLNGDGRVDVIREIFPATSGNGAYLNSASGFSGTSDEAHRLPFNGVVRHSFVKVETNPGEPEQVDSQGIVLADLTREGRADFIQVKTAYRYFSGPQYFSSQIHQIRGDAGWEVVPEYDPNNFPGQITDSNVLSFAAQAGEFFQGSHITDGITRLADFTGDGRPDIFTRGHFDQDGIFTLFVGFAAHRTDNLGFESVEPDRYALQPCSGFSECVMRSAYAWIDFDVDPQISSNLILTRAYRLGKRHADVNGDGLADLLTALSFQSPPENFPSSPLTERNAYLNNGRDYIQPSDARWIVPDQIVFDRHDANFIARDDGFRTADINGDGLVDIIQSKTGTREFWINSGDPNDSGGPWHKQSASSPWQVPLDMDFVDGQELDQGTRLVDLNGDGMVDLIRAIAGQAQSVYLNQGSVPDLMTSAQNPLGGSFGFEYAPSTQFDNTGDDDIPDLGQIVQVVKKITTDDGNGTIGTTRFDYAGGLFDPDDREFRGFHMVEAESMETGIKTVNHYHQSDACAGLLESTERKDDQDTLWLEVQNEYSNGCAGSEPFISQLAAQTVLEYDGAATPRRSRVEFLYDGYGNRSAAIQYGEVDAAAQDLDPNDTRTLATKFEIPRDDASFYLVDRATRSQLRSGPDPNAGTILRETTFGYDNDAVPTGELLTRVEKLDDPNKVDPTTTFTYTSFGHLETVTDPRNNTTDLEYDTTFHSFVTAVENRKNQRTEFGYAPDPNCPVQYPAGAGLLHIEKSPNDLAAADGQHWVRCYDVLGRITSDRAPLGLSESLWEYDDTPGAIRVTRRDIVEGGERAIEAQIDGLGRTVQTTADGPQGLDIIQTHGYDELGRLVRQSAPHFPGDPNQATTFAYDPLNRTARVTLPSGGSLRETTSTYDRGLVIVTDPKGHVSETEINVFGNVTEVREHSDSEIYTTMYRYDLANSLTQLTDHAGNTTLVAYDRLGRKTLLDDPDSGQTIFDYDSNGNQTLRADAAGNTTWTYDALDRPLVRSIAGIQDASWVYDTVLVGIGLLATQTDDSGVYEVNLYDRLGRPLQETQTTASNALAFVNQFNQFSEVTQRQYPNGRTLEWVRDARGFLQEIRSPGETSYASAIQWDARGRLQSWIAGNGLPSGTTYDPTTGRLAGLSVGDPNGTLLEDRTYAFDAADLVQSIQDQIEPSRSQSFLYDDLNRLTQAQGAYGQLNYAHDPVGNLTCKDALYAPSLDPGCLTGLKLSYSGASPAHAPTTVGGLPAQYGPTGNLESLNGRSYGYDALGQLRDAFQDSALLAEFSYDASGRRARVIDHTGTAPAVRHLVSRDFEWDQTQSLAQIHIELAGSRIATQVESYSGSPASVAPGAPLSRPWIFGGAATPAALALLLLALHLAALRRRGIALPEPALAGAVAIVFYLGTVSPVLAQIPDGDLNEDGKLDAVDYLLMQQLIEGKRAPTQSLLLHGDLAPRDQTPEVPPHIGVADAALLAGALSEMNVDGDFVPAQVEIALGGSPFRADTDRDGLYDNEEELAGTALGDYDTDDDGLSDLDELLFGTDPFTPDPDTDGDGLRDAIDPDPTGAVIYRHADHLGSSVLLTRHDGGTIGRVAYKPFGEVMPVAPGAVDDAPTFGFTSQRYVAPLDLYDYGARFYDPTLGRFLQPDSLVPEPFNPQSLNRYAYVLNNPTNLIDPTGNQAESLPWTPIPVDPPPVDVIPGRSDSGPSEPQFPVGIPPSGRLGFEDKLPIRGETNMQVFGEPKTTNISPARTRARVERTRFGVVTEADRERALDQASTFFTAVGLASLLLVPVAGEAAVGGALGIGAASSAGGLVVSAEQEDAGGILASAAGLFGAAFSSIRALRSLTLGPKAGEGGAISGSQLGTAASGASAALGSLLELNDRPGSSSDPRGRLNQSLREQGRLRTP